MRGENSPLAQVNRSAAVIIDKDGSVKYHVVPNRLMVFGLASMGLLIIVIIVLGMMMILNRWDIKRLEDTIRVDETTQQGR